MITLDEAITEAGSRVKELRQRQEWLNAEMGGLPVVNWPSQVICLLKGICPVCGLDVTIISVGGTPEFLSKYLFSGYPGACIWIPYKRDRFDGGVALRCKKGHKHYIRHTKAGWD